MCAIKKSNPIQFQKQRNQIISTVLLPFLAKLSYLQQFIVKPT